MHMYILSLLLSKKYDGIIQRKISKKKGEIRILCFFCNTSFTVSFSVSYSVYFSACFTVQKSEETILSEAIAEAIWLEIYDKSRDTTV